MYRLRQLDVDDKVCEQVSPGVLERIYPTEIIEQCVQASEQWIGTKRRVRQSTARALVLFVMLLALWSRLNQRQVWQKLVGGLSKLHPEDSLYKMSSSALTARRGELGSQVMETLLGACCHPIARPEQTPEAFFGRYRLMAIDGTLFNVADGEVNEEAFGRSSNQFGKGAYPQVRCVLLAECGTHAVVGMQISRYDEVASAWITCAASLDLSQHAPASGWGDHLGRICASGMQSWRPCVGLIAIGRMEKGEEEQIKRWE